MGHLAPALVVAARLREAGHRVSFVASAGRADASIIESVGFPVRTFTIGGLPRSGSIVTRLRAIGRAIVGVLTCIRIVHSERPDVLLGGGGFVAAPAALAARLSRVPVVVTEADAHLGLANRIAGRCAVRLCTAYPLDAFRAKQTVTGRPVEPAFFTVDRAASRTALGVGDDDRCVVVFGGSGGAQRLSDAVWDAFGSDDVLSVDGHPIVILHVTGRRDHARYAEREQPADQRLGIYRLIEYCDDMPSLLGAADLVVARAGGSVFELAATGSASVLVPGRLAGDHQRRNAAWFEQRGAAMVIDDEYCDGPHVRAVTLTLLSDEGTEARTRMGLAMRRLARPDAAAAITDIVTAVGAAFARSHDR